MSTTLLATMSATLPATMSDTMSNSMSATRVLRDANGMEIRKYYEQTNKVTD